MNSSCIPAQASVTLNSFQVIVPDNGAVALHANIVLSMKSLTMKCMSIFWLPMVITMINKIEVEPWQARRGFFSSH